MKRKYVIRHMALLLSILMLSSPPCSVLADSELVSAGTGTENTEEIEESRVPEEELLTGTMDLETEGDMTEDEPILSGTQDTDESMIYGLFDGQFSESDKLQSILDKGQAYLKSVLKNPVIGTTGGEWSVIALARRGNLDDEIKDIYIANVFKTVSENNGVLASRMKLTEYSRVSLGLSSVGVNPTDILGYNLLYPLSDFEGVCFQGLNGPIWALLAFDSGNYKIPALTKADKNKGYVQATREKFIDIILTSQNSHGGWALDNSYASSDIDITAMAIYAIAPYYLENADVKAAVDRAVGFLSEMQGPDGAYYGWKEINLESTAQTMIALATLDVSLLTDDRFIKNGNSILDVIGRLQTEEGGFQHTSDTGAVDAIATDQANEALTAYYRALNGQTALFDMTDIISGSEDEEPEESVKAFKERLESLPKELTLDNAYEVYALYSTISLMGDFQEKETLLQTVVEKVNDIVAQREEVNKLDSDIWNKINPLKISIGDKDIVEALMERYNDIPEANRKEEYIKNLKDLLNADIIIRKLKKGLLAKEIFEYVKDSGTDYTYTGDGYTITLVGNNAYTPGEMKNGISMKEEGSGLTFTMAESGILPGTVNVTIRTSLSTGTYDMYQNDNGTLKKLNQIFVKDGKFTCSVSKGGTYDLKKVGTDAAEETALLGTKSAAPAETETSSNNKSTSSTSSGISGSNIKNSTEESSTIKAEVKDGVVAAKAFEDIKGRNKNLKMTGKTVDGKEYTLTINGKDVKKTVDMKIGVTTKSDNQEDIKKLAGDPYILHFEQSGEFPGIMLVEIPIEKSDGDYLLFYYNKEERKAEYIQRVVIKDKKTKFLVSKGGDYFIDKKAKVKSLNDTNEEKKKIKTDTAAANSISDMKEEPVLAGTMEVQPEKGSFPVLSIVIIVLGCGGIAAAVVMLRKRRH